MLIYATSGLGSALVYSVSNWETDNQFLLWQIYPLIVFVIISVLLQINYLNKALNLFSTSIVSPVYYVFFTTSTIVTSAILFMGFKVDGVVAIISLLIGFFVIISGVALLLDFNMKQKHEGSIMELHTIDFTTSRIRKNSNSKRVGIDDAEPNV